MHSGETADGLEHPHFVLLVERRYGEVLASQTRQVRLGEADDLGVPARCIGEKAVDLLEPVIERGGDARSGEGDDHSRAVSRSESRPGGLKSPAPP